VYVFYHYKKKMMIHFKIQNLKLTISVDIESKNVNNCDVVHYSQKLFNYILLNLII